MKNPKWWLFACNIKQFLVQILFWLIIFAIIDYKGITLRGLIC
jgi:hypothetical protein